MFIKFINNLKTESLTDFPQGPDHPVISTISLGWVVGT